MNKERIIIPEEVFVNIYLKRVMKYKNKSQVDVPQTNNIIYVDFSKVN